MIYLTFEIGINLFQGLLMLMYVCRCFAYEKKHPIAGALLVLSCAGFLTALLLSGEYLPYVDLLFYLFPAVYALALSCEKRISVVYWLSVLALVFNMFSVVTFPIFSLLPRVLPVRFPSGQAEDVIRILATNLVLYAVLRLVVYIKQGCPPPGASSYAAFIVTLASALMVEEALYSLYLSVGEIYALPFFLAYVGLIVFVLMTLVLFRIVSGDAERKSRYQTEIAMLGLTRQHQQELSRMYENLTARQHDYKQHLQTLTQLVADGESRAGTYLSGLLRDGDKEDVLLTGSPETDALLTAKRRTMLEQGIQFRYSPYPLAQLPIPAFDFCAIVGNLLDNAIEGVMRTGAPSGSAYIHLSFYLSWDMFYIYCENPCSPGAISIKKGRFVSTKGAGEPGLHGVGLHSIETIALRAQGRADFRAEDGVFRAKVVLPYLPNHEQA